MQKDNESTQKTENQSCERYFDVDLNDVLRERFSTGQGVVLLQSGMDEMMLTFAIKQAISLSKSGKPFTVILPSRRADQEI